MSETFTEPVAAAETAAPPPAVTDAAARVAKYATDVAAPEPAAPAVEPPARQWSPEQLQQDPAFQAWFAENVMPEVDQHVMQQLQAEGLLEYGPGELGAEVEEIDYGPGELEALVDEVDRADRVEAFESAMESHDAMAEIVRGWQGELGAQVDPDVVIRHAAEAFATAEAIGYRLTGDDAVAMVRMAAEQFAVFEHGEQRIGDQIAREGKVLGLIGEERGVVRELAEALLPAIAKRRGALDAVAAREAVAEAARKVAGHPDRPIQSTRERVLRFSRQAEEHRNAAYSPTALRAAVIAQRSASKSGGRR